MISRRQFIRGTVGAFAILPSVAFSASSDDHQAIVSNVRTLIETLDLIGQPLEQEDRSALAAATSAYDPADSLRSIRNILSRYVLARITLNPESRVSVVQGDAPPILVEGGWRAFCLEIANEGSVTSQLNVISPQAKPVFEYSPGSGMIPTGIAPKGAAYPLQTVKRLDVEERWLALELHDQAPMPKKLEGLSLEYQILLLYSRDRGKRAADFHFDAGPATTDLGFRSRLHVVFSCLPATPVALHILDQDGTPTTARLTITDTLGHVYPAQIKRLAPDLGFQRQIYRSDGQSVLLPSGIFTMEYSRGPEYVTKLQHVNISGVTDKQTITLNLERWINPGDSGWFSGDHHIHAAGCRHYTTPAEGIRPADVIYQVRGEGLSVGDVLTWGPSWYFQKQFFRNVIDPVSAGGSILKYDVEVAGFPSSHCGHLALLGLQDQDFPNAAAIEEWPSWNLPILKWAKAQGATVGYAHTGHGLVVDSQQLPNYLIPPFDDNGANEYLIDVVHGAVDFLSVVDTPAIAELNLWYHALNCGFRTTIAGETDFPCLFERVGVGRTYVQLDKTPSGEMGYREWISGLKNGRSYVSEGKSHLMDFAVDGVAVSGSGNELRLGKPTEVTVTARVAALCSESLQNSASGGQSEQVYWDVELARLPGRREVMVEVVVNGERAKAVTIQGDGKPQQLKVPIRVERSSWIALRILPSSHTNPIFVTVADKPMQVSTRSAEWCLQCIEESWKKRVEHIKAADLVAAQSACDHARSVLAKLSLEM
jgi:hypothetical protein